MQYTKTQPKHDQRYTAVCTYRANITLNKTYSSKQGGGEGVVAGKTVKIL